jgi:hypothetical protein
VQQGLVHQRLVGDGVDLGQCLVDLPLERRPVGRLEPPIDGDHRRVAQLPDELLGPRQPGPGRCEVGEALGGHGRPIARLVQDRDRSATVLCQDGRRERPVREGRREGGVRIARRAGRGRSLRPPEGPLVSGTWLAVARRVGGKGWDGHAVRLQERGLGRVDATDAAASDRFSRSHRIA